MDDHEDSLRRARQAYAAQDWRSAADSYDVVAPHRLTADDLAAYASASWWLGGSRMPSDSTLPRATRW